MKDKKRLIDIGLVIIILAMGGLVFSRVVRVFEEMNYLGQETQEPKQPKVLEDALTTTPVIENSQDVKPAPDFTLTSLDGDPVALSDHQGQAVMINFWATWCPPCLAELPLIESFAENHPDKLVVLAVNAGEERASVRNFVDKFGYDLQFLLDPSNSLASQYQVRGLPTSVFIDQQGLIQGMHIGLLDESLLSNYLSQVGVVE